MNLKNIRQKETRVISINITGNKNQPSLKDKLKFKALEEGTFARDLVQNQETYYIQMSMQSD